MYIIIQQIILSIIVVSIIILVIIVVKKKLNKSKIYIGEDKIIIGDLELDLERFIVKIRGKEVELTIKEFEVLKYLANQPGQVVTRELLLEKVWGQ